MGGGKGLEVNISSSVFVMYLFLYQENTRASSVCTKACKEQCAQNSGLRYPMLNTNTKPLRNTIIIVRGYHQTPQCLSPPSTIYHPHARVVPTRTSLVYPRSTSSAVAVAAEDCHQSSSSQTRQVTHCH